MGFRFGLACRDVCGRYAFFQTGRLDQRFDADWHDTRVPPVRRGYAQDGLFGRTFRRIAHQTRRDAYLRGFTPETTETPAAPRDGRPVSLPYGVPDPLPS